MANDILISISILFSWIIFSQVSSYLISFGRKELELQEQYEQLKQDVR